MANVKKALADNVDGIYFVDSSCINCGVSRHYAPDVFGDNGSRAYVKQQPQNDATELATQQALLACPVASIGMRQKRDLSRAKNSLPKELAPNVFINAFNHQNSYGAHSYFIQAKSGNWLIDSPRYTSHLVKKFEEMGGVKYIFLTHRDDVADAHRYADHFKAQRIIHQLDADAQEEAEIIIQGDEVTFLDEGEIHFTPGHTQGHHVLLWQNRYLFTGDHFAWDATLNRFAAFRNSCWYSWDKQIDSVAKLQAFDKVEWIFPGHGKWAKIENNALPEIIRDTVEWMHSVK